jgi:hypothetical protein
MKRIESQSPSFAAAANIATKYRERTGNICQTWLCETADGAH